MTVVAQAQPRLQSVHENKNSRIQGTPGGRGIKGIMFKPWKLKWIASLPMGAEYQARRLSGLEKINEEPDQWWLSRLVPQPYHEQFIFINKDNILLAVKPHFHPGETVYLKEALIGQRGSGAFYRNDSSPVKNLPWRWQTTHLPALFMPECAARYFALVKSVRAERLQNISWEDTHAEGIFRFDRDHPEPTNGSVGYNRGAPGLPMRYESIAAYMDLWDSINGKGAWALNPFVGAYTLEKTDEN